MVLAAAGESAVNEWGELIAGIVAVVAAGVFVGGMALMQKGNLLVMERAQRDPTRTSGAVATVTHPIWIVGAVTMAVGFGLHAVALGLGSIAVVQPLQVSQIIFMVPFSAWVVHASIRRQDWLGAGLVVAGLAAFIVATQPTEGVDTVGGWEGWVLWTGIILAVTVALWLVAYRVPPYKAALMGTAVGVLYGLEAGVLKQAVGQLGDGPVFTEISTWWAIPSILAICVALVFLQNVAMRAGRLSASLSTITVVSPISAAVLGIALFEESISTTPLAIVGALAGTTVAIVGVVMLARSPALLAADEAEEAEDVPEPESAM